MKKITLLFLYIFFFNLFAQEKIPVGVLFVGTFGVNQNEKVEYLIESKKVTWINTFDSTFLITYDSSLIRSRLETTGNSNDDPSHWDCWFAVNSGSEPQIAYGFYKFSNSKNGNLYFYLDTRDCRWGGSLSTYYVPDIFVKIDFETNSLSYSEDKINWTTFLPGSILKVWEIKNEGSPETKYFEPPSIKEFSISNNNTHPVLNWNCEEFYTNFNIERKISDENWIQIGQTSETQFIDEDIKWSGGNNSLTVQYRIWTVNSNLISSNSSPIKSITINPDLQKKSNSKSAQFVTINFDTTGFERVLNIDFDKNNNIWITLNVVSKYLALVKYDGINWHSWKVSEIFDVNPNNHFVVAIDSSNLIWLYILGKGLVSFNGNDFNIHYAGSPQILKYPRMTIDKYNNKWIFGPVSFGLFKIDSIDNYFLYTTSNSPLPSNNGGIIYPDGDSLWICTFNGLVKIYNNEWQIFDTTNTKMPSQEIFSFAKDLNSIRWLGTRNMGLLKWINDSTFLVFNSNNAPFLNNFVNVITVDKFNNLWIGTDNGLLKYDGTNFTLIEPTINHNILDVKIDKFNNKWIASYYSLDDWGLAIYNENGVQGISLPTNVDNESYIDKKFVLYQNYPNPFNSKTKIKFSISNSGSVSLKIYNLLGQEIATLVNETKQIGEYEIEFDGDQYNLSSGVYIYQLKNNSLVQSKKFILMK